MSVLRNLFPVLAALVSVSSFAEVASVSSDSKKKQDVQEAETSSLEGLSGQELVALGKEKRKALIKALSDPKIARTKSGPLTVYNMNSCDIENYDDVVLSYFRCENDVKTNFSHPSDDFICKECSRLAGLMETFSLSSIDKSKVDELSTLFAEMSEIVAKLNSAPLAASHLYEAEKLEKWLREQEVVITEATRKYKAFTVQRTRGSKWRLAHLAPVSRRVGRRQLDHKGISAKEPPASEALGLVKRGIRGF